MRLLISGTDTAIGKTLVACSILHALHARGVTAIGMKPVAAGVTPNGTWEDVELIRQAGAAGARGAAIEDTAPYRLRASASPHFAAQEDGIAIQEQVILSALERLERIAEVVVIEGVGGFRVPLSEKLDSADLAKAIGAAVLIVVPMRLGCINHALLTAEAITNRGLALLGWVANAGIDPDYGRVAQTVDTISNRTHKPCLGILPAIPLGQSGADHLNIDSIITSLRSLADSNSSQILHATLRRVP